MRRKLSLLVLALLALWAPEASAREWLAGDLHVHTCYSHDAWCPGVDEEADPFEAYTLSVSVRDRFREARSRGLDYLAITDHNDLRSVSDPGFGSGGVIGVPGYEASLEGHAQALGARRLYGSDALALAGALRADEGVLQVNHPGYRIERPFTSCGDTSMLDWEYGFELRPDTIELWNPTSGVQEAERYLECWLERGERVGATGGSDAHWLATQPVGAGWPTTWVHSKGRSADAVLEALRQGRTSVTKRPPALGARPLLIEGDPNRDGRFRSVIGKTVPPGTPLRVRSRDPAATGVLRVRANGRTRLDEPLPPGGELRFKARRPGWLRAVLRAAPGAEAAPGCEPPGQPISDCAYDLSLVALTSPVYVAAPSS